MFYERAVVGDEGDNDAVLPIQIGVNGYVFACTILEDECMVGGQVYLQGVLLDGCSASGFAMTPGLEITIGDL